MCISKGFNFTSLNSASLIVRLVVFITASMVFTACSSDDETTETKDMTPINKALAGYYSATGFRVELSTEVKGNQTKLVFQSPNPSGSALFANELVGLNYNTDVVLTINGSVADTISLNVSSKMKVDVLDDMTFRLYVRNDSADSPIALISGISISDVHCTVKDMTSKVLEFDGTFSETMLIGGLVGGSKDASQMVEGSIKITFKR